MTTRKKTGKALAEKASARRHEQAHQMPADTATVAAASITTASLEEVVPPTTDAPPLITDLLEPVQTAVHPVSGLDETPSAYGLPESNEGNSESVPDLPRSTGVNDLPPDEDLIRSTEEEFYDYEPVVVEDPTADPVEPVKPAVILWPMAGEGVAAIMPDEGEPDGVLPDKPQYNSTLILESLIDLSPQNHRETVDEPKVQMMAANMRHLKYVIHPVTVRIVVDGRYELVVGELRLRAARLAGIVYIPAVIRVLTDGEVDDMQLAENIHRDDPHIMAQARKVGSMVNEKKSIADIALILGLSTTAVYTRYHLSNLIPDFERLYRADIIKTKEVTALATLSQESQQSLYNEIGKGWEERKTAYGSNIPYIVSRYRCDLNNTLFDHSENDIIPGVKSCIGCRFNLSGDNARTLFDDDPKLVGRCGNATCFDNKTWAVFCRNLAATIRDHSISAILFEGGPSKIMDEELPKIPGALQLKRFDSDDVTFITPPLEPLEEHYITSYGEKDNAWKEPFDHDHAEYTYQMGHLTAAISEGKVIAGLLIHGFEIKPVLFTANNTETETRTETQPQPEQDEQQQEQTKVAKMTTSQIKEAVVEKTVDVQVLKNEITSIQVKQTTAERDDKINVAKAISAELRDKTLAACKSRKLTASNADNAGTFIVLYNALSYKNRSAANQFFFGKAVDQIDGATIVKYARKCTGADIACLVRLYISYSEESKHPNQPAYGLMREIALAAGVNVKKIEADSEATAEKRRKQNTTRISQIKKAIAKAEGKQEPATAPPPAQNVKAQPSPKKIVKPAAKKITGKAGGKRAAQSSIRKRSKKQSV